MFKILQFIMLRNHAIKCCFMFMFMFMIIAQFHVWNRKKKVEERRICGEFKACNYFPVLTKCIYFELDRDNTKYRYTALHSCSQQTSRLVNWIKHWLTFKVIINGRFLHRSSRLYVGIFKGTCNLIVRCWNRVISV